jgi:hypothetical protein
MPIKVWKGQPKDYAEGVDYLKQHARGEHGSKIGKLGHVQSPPNLTLEDSLTEETAAV